MEVWNKVWEEVVQMTSVLLPDECDDLQKRTQNDDSGKVQVSGLVNH